MEHVHLIAPNALVIENRMTGKQETTGLTLALFGCIALTLLPLMKFETVHAQHCYPLV